MIGRAPDSTVFLSTAALIVGIFLAAVAAALVGGLPEDPKKLARQAGSVDNETKYKRLIRGMLFCLLIVNTLGMVFPFTLLLVDTVTVIQAVWVWIAFIYTMLVIFVNLGAVSMVYLAPMRARGRRKVSMVVGRSDVPATAPSTSSGMTVAHDVPNRKGEVGKRITPIVAVAVVAGFIANEYAKRMRE